MRNSLSSPIAGGLALALLALFGCSSGKTGGNTRSFPLGSPVRVGPLTVTAIDTEWRAQLPAETGARLPRHRFLLINVSVTNGGGAAAALPLLHLIDEKGAEHLELDKGDGVLNWLGFLRMIEPAHTEQGMLLFDVPPASYRLRVSYGGDPATEVYSYVEIPLRLDKSVGSVDDPMAPPPQ